MTHKHHPLTIRSGMLLTVQPIGRQQDINPADVFYYSLFALKLQGVCGFDKLIKPVIAPKTLLGLFAHIQIFNSLLFFSL